MRSIAFEKTEISIAATREWSMGIFMFAGADMVAKRDAASSGGL